MAKYLFLDLYGVLTLDGCPISDDYGPLFDPTSVDNLEHIIDQSHPHIVITSSWRTQGMDWLRSLWLHRSMPSRLYSATPILERTQYEVVDDIHVGSVLSITERYAKGLEIERWLQTHAEGPYNYAILDDEAFFLSEQSAHLVQTRPDVGLTASVAHQVITLLKQGV